MDAKIRIDVGITIALAEDEWLSTFLCGANRVDSCATCHPSCFACTVPGTCDSCHAFDRATKSDDGAYCIRNGVTEWDGIDDYRWNCPAGANIVLEQARRAV